VATTVTVGVARLVVAVSLDVPLFLSLKERVNLASHTI
jgi:hypothetical protein